MGDQLIDHLGGVLCAMEFRYQRGQIQSASHRYEQQINTGARPIIALNKYSTSPTATAHPSTVRTPSKRKQLQIDRLRAFRRKHARHADRELDALTQVVQSGGNTFAQLLKTVEHCSLGQITQRLQKVLGTYRPTV